MQLGEVIACEHCPDEIVNETTEGGATIQRARPVTHPIVGFVPHRTITEDTEAGTVVVGTFNDGRPILECPSLYKDQIHESGRMRLVGTAERP